MASGPPLIPLSQVCYILVHVYERQISSIADPEQLDSPFQLQEHLKALYHNYTRPPGSSTLAPITREIATRLAEPPEGVERSLWLYELCRFLTMKANNLIIAFFAENPACSAKTCPEMRASEWQYLCAVHDPPKACCAIDYCCHTLDWATNILTSPKFFPSRLTLGSDASGGAQTSMRHLTNIFRRVYRIFAHAWFQHRDVFWQVEGSDGLYMFFKAVCDMYRLIPEDNYTVPPEAEGEEEAEAEEKDGEKGETRKVVILRKEDHRGGFPVTPGKDDADPMSLNVATQRRHRYSSSRPVSVTTITEAAEDDDDDVNDKFNISVDEPNLGLGSLETTESPVEMPAATEGDCEATISDEERADMDKTPSNIESQMQRMELEESQEVDEDIGSPGPAERHPEPVIVIAPHPEDGRKVTHHHHGRHEVEEQAQAEEQGVEQEETQETQQEKQETQDQEKQEEKQEQRQEEAQEEQGVKQEDKQEEAQEEKPEEKEQEKEQEQETLQKQVETSGKEATEEDTAKKADDKADEKTDEKMDEKTDAKTDEKAEQDQGQKPEPQQEDLNVESPKSEASEVPAPKYEQEVAEKEDDQKAEETKS